jgi:hypothetical protein
MQPPWLTFLRTFDVVSAFARPLSHNCRTGTPAPGGQVRHAARHAPRKTRPVAARGSSQLDGVSIRLEHLPPECKADGRVLTSHARRADPVTVETVGIGPVLVGWSVANPGLRTRGRTRQAHRPG